MSSIAPDNNTRRQGRVTDSWITPKWLLDQLGHFDLDPCACDPQPWPTADTMLTVADDGLSHEWEGFVFCNPPYGKALGIWLSRMKAHDNGIALIFGRTDTAPFHEHVFNGADSILFLRGRLTFCRPDGSKAEHNSGGPSVLIAYGHTATMRLLELISLGKLLKI